MEKPLMRSLKDSRSGISQTMVCSFVHSFFHVVSNSLRIPWVESTVWPVRTRFLAEGLPAAVARRAQPERPEKRKLAGEQEAHLIALACQNPLDGRERWTLRLLADKLVELEVVSSVSHETVRTTLKKTNSSPGKSRNGASRPKPMRLSWQRWKTSSRSINDLTMDAFRRFAWTRSANNC